MSINLELLRARGFDLVPNTGEGASRPPNETLDGMPPSPELCRKAADTARRLIAAHRAIKQLDGPPLLRHVKAIDSVDYQVPATRSSDPVREYARALFSFDLVGISIRPHTANVEPTGECCLHNSNPQLRGLRTLSGTELEALVPAATAVFKIDMTGLADLPRFLPTLIYNSVTIVNLLSNLVHVVTLRPEEFLVYDRLRTGAIKSLQRMLINLLPNWRLFPDGVMSNPGQVLGRPGSYNVEAVLAICRAFLRLIADALLRVPQCLPRSVGSWVQPWMQQSVLAALADASSSIVLDARRALIDDKPLCATGSIDGRPSPCNGCLLPSFQLLRSILDFAFIVTAALPALRASDFADTALRGGANIRTAMIEYAVKLPDEKAEVLDEVAKDALALWFTIERLLNGEEVCRAPAPCRSDHKTLQKCSGCRSPDALFCSKACLKRAWPRHRDYCKRHRA